MDKTVFKMDAIPNNNQPPAPSLLPPPSPVVDFHKSPFSSQIQPNKLAMDKSLDEVSVLLTATRVVVVAWRLPPSSKKGVVC